jgi:D-sedoheptulose 7-phosphate isomerase
METKDIVCKQIADSIAVKQAVLADKEICKAVEIAANAVVEAYRNGHRALLAGNGGSAADAQHIAGELVSKFYFERPAIDAVALTTNTSILTAIGNDLGYEVLFSRQVEAMGHKGDVFIGISTSGNSKNIVKALEVCKERGIYTIGLTGESGGAMKPLCDLCIQIPSSETPRVQEAHMMIGHIICCLVEEELFGEVKIRAR